MPAERVSMRKIREALRLTHAMGMSRRLVGEATGIGKTAVGEYVRRAAAVSAGRSRTRSMMPRWSGGCFRRRMQVRLRRAPIRTGRTSMRR
jgi:hypothetical protein